MNNRMTAKTKSADPFCPACGGLTVGSPDWRGVEVPREDGCGCHCGMTNKERKKLGFSCIPATEHDDSFVQDYRRADRAIARETVIRQAISDHATQAWPDEMTVERIIVNRLREGGYLREELS